MLLELEIKGFALVDHLVLEFEEGMTALTGETGAGKSVILDSLSFLLGGNSAAANEGQHCRVSGRFEPTATVLAFLGEQGLPADERELLITRERKPRGRTTSRLNGSLVTVEQLRQLCLLLLDFHGQHQSYGLTRPSTHLPMLDRLAGEGQARDLRSYARKFGERVELANQIAELHRSESHRLREIEWLQLELEQIESAAPEAGEDDALEADIRRRAASEELANGVGAALNALEGDGLTDALSALSTLPRFDASISEPLERLRSAEIEVLEASRFLQGYLEDLEHDPRELDRLQQRAETLKGLKRKFGPTLEDVANHLAAGRERLELLQHSDHHLEHLQSQLGELDHQLEELASKLTRRRQRAARSLCQEVVQELGQLAMPRVSFEVDFQPLGRLGPSGAESAQFHFSPNPGRVPTALAETASGGELSRVMLALVSILSRYQKQPTMIFDEIDAGLGGRTAEAVAQRLSQLAERVQVLCVTHLPVVAAAATSHLLVEKQTRGEETVVTVQRMEQAARVAEVARMLSGDASQKKAQNLARDLLQAGRA